MWTGCLFRWNFRLHLINDSWICNSILSYPLLFPFEQLDCTWWKVFFSLICCLNSFSWVLDIHENYYCKLLLPSSPLEKWSYPLNHLQKSITDYRLGLWERGYRWCTLVFFCFSAFFFLLRSHKGKFTLHYCQPPSPLHLRSRSPAPPLKW